MARLNRLHGVAHDIAHHAGGSFSYLSPHLLEACQAAGIRVVAISLIGSESYPASLPDHGPLRLALAALRARFAQMLQACGLDVALLSEARLDITFPERLDGSVFGVHSTLLAQGRRYEWDFPLPDDVTLARPRPSAEPRGTRPIRPRALE